MVVPLKSNRLLLGDCHEVLKKIPDNSVDLVLTDMPYGVTACAWDSVLDLPEIWKQLYRVSKEKTPFVLFSSQPFTTTLIGSNLKHFKYVYTWEKNFSTNFLHAKRQPLRKTEDIVVFYRKSGQYFPIKTTGHKPTQSSKGSSVGKLWHGKNVRNSAGGDTTRYPTNILKFDAVDPKKRIHPSQKPVKLLSWLIRTFTSEGDVVLDFCMGSGSTGIAALKTNRRFIGIEKTRKIYNTAKARLLRYASRK